ncbi:SMI1/KNR4 family protein [Streptomyces maoxianensis]|uniref:SMI1/KNR4 family protein n=1 Tax=Streptomyces maoxianensis TaxID=1459942 RepID=A0ABV9GCH5_9ACTN
MSAATELAWGRVAQWLEVLAPSSWAAIRPPATAAGIREAQERMGVSFPDDLVTLLRLHDGAENTEAATFLPSARLLPLHEMASIHLSTCDLLDSADLLGTWWHPQWIPFAANHDGWSRWFLDARPGPGFGAVGSFFMESGGDCGRWPSLAVFLEEMADAVEDVRPLGNHLPRVDDEALSWD